MPTLSHPYANLAGGQWVKGNLHTHTTRSDGARPPQAVIDDYAARGYGYLMISDHDMLTAAADFAAWDARGMTLIPGNEITAAGPHILHVGADRRIEPVADRQRVIDAVVASGSGFTIVNHPNWCHDFNHCPIESMVAWQGYLGMEVFNGTIGRLQGSPYATNKWDILLSQGRHLWGFANDDSHKPALDVGLGWNVAYLRDRTPAAILAALAAGRFYPSTGVEITAIQVEGLHIHLATTNAQRIVALGKGGQRYAQVDATSIDFDVPPEASHYIRFECWGSGEQFAWTQPFYLLP